VLWASSYITNNALLKDCFAIGSGLLRFQKLVVRSNPRLTALAGSRHRFSVASELQVSRNPMLSQKGLCGLVGRCERAPSAPGHAARSQVDDADHDDDDGGGADDFGFDTPPRGCTASFGADAPPVCGAESAECRSAADAPGCEPAFAGQCAGGSSAGGYSAMVPALCPFMCGSCSTQLECRFQVGASSGTVSSDGQDCDCGYKQSHCLECNVPDLQNTRGDQGLCTLCGSNGEAWYAVCV